MAPEPLTPGSFSREIHVSTPFNVWRTMDSKLPLLLMEDLEGVPTVDPEVLDPLIESYRRQADDRERRKRNARIEKIRDRFIEALTPFERRLIPMYYTENAGLFNYKGNRIAVIPLELSGWEIDLNQGSQGVIYETEPHALWAFLLEVLGRI